MSLRVSVRKSSSSICLLAGIQRPSIRLVFNQAGGAAASSSSSSPSASSSSPSSSSTLFAASRIGEDKACSDSSRFGLLLRSISGVLVGSAVGYLFCSSSSCSEVPLLYADWPRETNESAVVEDQDQRSGLLDVLEEKKSKFIFGDAFRRKVFFNYEKRLRLRSPPEKVFEYFASFRTPEGEVLMKPADLMRAVVPVFPPSESNLVREGCLSLERGPGDLHCAPSTFFMLFDTNNDGLISFAEYIFFVTILSIPESSFSIAFKMFDTDNNGEIDREEFKKVMALMRSRNRQGAHHRDGMRKGLKGGCSVDNGGLLEYFFGTDGNMSLQHAKFVEFLRDLHDEILRLEFAHYDFKQQGTISAIDFALSMVASADMSHISKFFNQVEKLNKKPQLRGICITWEEFKAFAELRKSLEPLTLAIFTYGKVNGLLTKQDFQRAASNVCGIDLTDNVVDIIFHVFDTNGDGSLSIPEFVRVIQRRERDTGQPSMEAGAMGPMSSWLKVAR